MQTIQLTSEGRVCRSHVLYLSDLSGNRAAFCTTLLNVEPECLVSRFLYTSQYCYQISRLGGVCTGNFTQNLEVFLFPSSNYQI